MNTPAMLYPVKCTFYMHIVYVAIDRFQSRKETQSWSPRNLFFNPTTVSVVGSILFLADLATRFQGELVKMRHFVLTKCFSPQAAQL